MLGGQDQAIELSKTAHIKSDVDTERTSQHHTLGRGPLQAAPGNHSHIGSVALYLGAIPPVGWLSLDGSVINKVDYPDFFSAVGVTTSTLTLPTVANQMVRVRQ